MRYRREIDGLRAVAVVPVILFHGGFDLFSGGYVGVDVFFVISGYLITSILISDLEAGTFSIARFYERRARRILPALFVVMLACLPFAWMWMSPWFLKDFAQSLIAVVFFSSNVLFWLQEGYFAVDSELKPLLHTWSLAVEEQYYLLFPIFLLVMWRFRRDRVFWSIAAIALASFVASAWGARNAPSTNFYLAPFRAWEPFAGSLAAFYLRGRGPRSSDLMSGVGLALILVSIFWYDKDTPFPGIYALAPVVGTALIVLFAGQTTLVARLLSTGPFVGIGLVSYSAYLWHQPLFAFARLHSFSGTSQTLLGSLTALTFLLAWATWKYVETPFRSRSKPVIVSRPNVFAASAALGALFVAIGLSGLVLTTRLSLVAPVDISLLEMPNRDDGYCFYDFDTHSDLSVDATVPSCRLGDGAAGGRKFLLFGDSYAAQWEPFFLNYARDTGIGIDVVTTNWCFPSARDEFTAPHGDISIDQCRINRSFLHARATDYDAIILAGSWVQVGEKAFSAGAFDMIDEVLATSGATVLIVDTPPLYAGNSVGWSFYSRSQELVHNAENDVSLRSWQAFVDRYGQNGRVVLIGRRFFGKQFAQDGRTDNGIPYSLDGEHISVWGALNAYKGLPPDSLQALRAVLY